MAKPETIRDYLAAVTGQIRWKRARPVLAQELERHLEDQKNDFLTAGQPPEEAERLAVAEMGDPVTVGTELDRIHRPRAQWGPLVLTAALALTGGLLRVFLYAVAPYTNPLEPDPQKTFLALLLGAICMLGAYFFDYSRLVKHAGLVYLSTLLVSALLLAFVSRYYMAYMALLYPVVYALWLFRCRGKGWLGFVAAILGGVPLACLVLLSHYLSALVLFLAAGFVLLLYAVGQDWFGVPRKWAAAVSVLLTAVLGGAGFYRYGHAMWSRLAIALHPELDLCGAGYQAATIQDGLRQSLWLGTPSAGDIYARNFLGWNTDFVLTGTICKLGWLPGLMVMAALCALCLWLAVRCLRQKSQSGRVVALAVVLTLGVQAVTGLASNLGFTLISGHLPLLAGNLYTVVDMALIGLALSVFRGSSIARDEPVTGKNLRVPRVHVRVSWE